MAFIKTGQAMPFKIASTVCELCRKRKAEHLVDGKMVCASCKEEKAQKK
jgi:hypothetical protein